MSSLGYSDESREEKGFSIPVGRQNLECHKAMITKKNSLCLVFKVDGGADHGSMFSMFYLIHNANSTCKRMAREALQSVAFAMGVNSYDDADDFLGQQLTADVGIEQGTNGYADKHKLSFVSAEPPLARKKEPVPPEQPKDYAPPLAEKEAVMPPDLKYSVYPDKKSETPIIDDDDDLPF